MLVLFILASFFAVILVAARPTRGSSFEAACERATALVPTNTYTAIAEAIDTYRLSNDKVFWQTVGGVRGLLKAVCVSWRMLQIVQVHRSFDHISSAEARTLWLQGLLQLIFSAFAVPGAILSAAWTLYPHAAALMAFSLHREIAVRLLSLSEEDDAPNSLRALAEIL